MKFDMVRYLVKMHVDQDEHGFRRVVEQLACGIKDPGRAEELRNVLRRKPTSNLKGDLAGLLVGRACSERIGDMVLPESLAALLKRLILENQSKDLLATYRVEPRRKFLFQGPPGTGKTLAAAVIAGELDLPLWTVRFDALFSSFLGATATRISAIFKEMSVQPGVYLFDEFDAVGMARGNSHDVGEMNRIVISFLQLMDADTSGSIIVAATNHEELLDRALSRRFDATVTFRMPSPKQAVDLVLKKLQHVGMDSGLALRVAECHKGYSFAELENHCLDALRTMVLTGRTHVLAEDLTDGRWPAEP